MSVHIVETRVTMAVRNVIGYLVSFETLTAVWSRIQIVQCVVSSGEQFLSFWRKHVAVIVKGMSFKNFFLDDIPKKVKEICLFRLREPLALQHSVMSQKTESWLLSFLFFRYFRKRINIYCEFVPQIIFMCFLFLYMVILMFFKWTTYGPSTGGEWDIDIVHVWKRQWPRLYIVLLTRRFVSRRLHGVKPIFMVAILTSLIHSAVLIWPRPLCRVWWFCLSVSFDFTHLSNCIVVPYSAFGCLTGISRNSVANEVTVSLISIM